MSLTELNNELIKHKLNKETLTLKQKQMKLLILFIKKEYKLYLNFG